MSFLYQRVRTPYQRSSWALFVRLFCFPFYALDIKLTMAFGYPVLISTLSETSLHGHSFGSANFVFTTTLERSEFAYSTSMQLTLFLIFVFCVIDSIHLLVFHTSYSSIIHLGCTEPYGPASDSAAITSFILSHVRALTSIYDGALILFVRFTILPSVRRLGFCATLPSTSSLRHGKLGY